MLGGCFPFMVMSELPHRTSLVLALRIPRGHHSAHRGLRKCECGKSACAHEDHFGDRVITELHGVHSGPRNAKPAAAAPQGHPVRDARDRVFGDDHRMPLLDRAAAPDPHRIGRLDRCRLTDTTPSPIEAAGAQQDKYKERAARHQDADAQPPRTAIAIAPTAITAAKVAAKTIQNIPTLPMKPITAMKRKKPAPYTRGCRGRTGVGLSSGTRSIVG